tara:strand:- start:92 stop:613 length:522 start_codon:yes stop_codon:yes gene_type:complete
MTNIFRLNLFSFFFILVFTEIKSNERKCIEIEDENGTYVIKYTFVKFTGTCFSYDTFGNLLEINNFVEGKKEGIFYLYSKGNLIAEYSMKDNLIHGTYKKFINNKLYKVLNYKMGNVMKCLVDLKYIISMEKEITNLMEKSSISSSLALDEKIEKIKRDILYNKENCIVKKLV